MVEADLAVLVALALRYAGDEVRRRVPGQVAVTAGYVMAFRIGAALLVLGGVLIEALFERVDPDLRDPTAEIVEGTPPWHRKAPPPDQLPAPAEM
ncbi:hypothetical protein ABIA33_002202 [Streptacidiphilus sp. MAP12-16]|uniref:hypothetical protein n=1 Tax=Streptacidiphilus sp. MAP12-16 TaxID=3156300 RepID=UPI003515CA94